MCHSTLLLGAKFLPTPPCTCSLTHHLVWLPSFDSDFMSVGSMPGSKGTRRFVAYKDTLVSMLYGEDQRRAMGAMVSCVSCAPHV